MVGTLDFRIISFSEFKNLLISMHKTRYGVELKHPVQPLLRVKPLFHVRNLLHNRKMKNLGTFPKLIFAYHNFLVHVHVYTAHPCIPFSCFGSNVNDILTLPRTEAQELEEYFIEIPPELSQLKIIGLSKDIGSSLSLLPSIMHRMENILVAIELKHMLSVSIPEMAEVSGHRV